jgi:hypothetical protein
MTHVKSYSTRLEADLAAIMLRAEGIHAEVVGVGLAMQGGVAGVRLLVADNQAAAAREALSGQ